MSIKEYEWKNIGKNFQDCCNYKTTNQPVIYKLKYKGTK